MTTIEITCIALSSVSIVLSVISMTFKGQDLSKAIESAVDLAERAQSLNIANGNKLTSNDKKNIALDHAKTLLKRKSKAYLSNMIEAEVERRKRAK